MRKNLHFFTLLKIILFNTNVLYHFQVCFLAFMSYKRIIFINIPIFFTWITFTFITIFNFTMFKATLSNSARLITIPATATVLS